ncbi:MAG: SDR family NAD(P)-dependent oxidoreductase [Planctomycetota bacterium]
MQLVGKIIVVTGASKGIGRAIALGLAAEGADLIVHYHTDAAGADAVARKIADLGRAALTVGADIAKVAEIDEMFGRIRSAFGRVDVLVNNAAVTGWSSLFETAEETWDWVVDTNLKGTFFCSLRAAAMMKEQGGGSIVNVSTNCAALGVKNLSCYAASKGGVHALTRQLAVELAPYKIRVNTFAPGPTRVERNLNDDPDYDRTWGSVVPWKRTADPQEMVGPALFLASDQSSYMTGQVFYVDGGWTVQGKIPEEHMDDVLRKRSNP